MPRSRIPSPARSQGVISTPRKDKLRRRTRSVCSPAQCNVPVRLSSLVSQSYKLSPMPNRQSVLNDETDIEIVPGRQSWWKKLGDDDSRDVMDVLGTKDMAEIKNLANEFDVEVLSQETKNYTLDIPESSDGESITSIVIPQQKLFAAQKDNNHQKDFAQILNSRDSQSKNKSHVNHDKDIKVAPKNLFSIPSKPRNRPVFPSALLNISANKTMNKTKEMTVAEVKGQVRSLFGNRPGTKRKNMFADFIVSDSEDDIPDIQPKVFGFQKNLTKKRRESSSSRASRHSPTSSIDLELDDWKLLPSSTMLGNQLEDTTPVKRARLSKLSEVKESVTVSTINKTMNKTKQSNKSMNAKNKSKISSNSKLDAERSRLKDDNINVVQSNDQGTNSSTSRLTRNKSKSIRETSLTEANRSKTINKSRNITNKDQSIVNKVDDNQGNINQPQDEDNLQNELLDEGEGNEDFTLEYENDDEQNMECVDNSPNDCQQSKSPNNTSNKTSNEIILNKENENVLEGTYNRQESINKSQQINKNMDIDMLDGNTTKEPVQLNNKQEIQNINNEKLGDTENVKSKTNVSIHNTSKNHNKSKQNKVETDCEINQDNHNNTRNQIQNKNSQHKSNYVCQEIGHECENHDQSKPISKVNEEENENNKEVNVNSEQNNTEENAENNESNEQNNAKGNEKENVNSNQNNTEENEEIVSDTEDQNRSRETQHEAQDESDQIISEQEQNESEKHEEMEDRDLQLNQSDEDEEDDFNTAEQDDEGVTSNHEEETETDEQQNESIEINENEEQGEENEERDEENDEQEEENEEQDEENEDEDEEIEDQDEENEEQVMESDQDVENEEQEVENEEEHEEEEDDEEQDMENDHQESNESEVESNEDESEQVDQDNPFEEENDNEEEEVSGNKNNESPNITHDTTGKHRNIQKVTSPEAILHDKTNQIDSFMAEGRNTSVRKTKSIMIKTLNIRPSLAPVRESTGISDGTRNSSADNSGWDSHRTTRKTLRQTFGKDFTPRKSLRALVMEKSAKRHTNFVEKEADLTENVDNKIPQANSTELPHFDSYVDPEPVHVDETAISTVEESNREEHEVSKRTRQTTLEMYLEKIKQDNLERRRRIEEQVRNSLKTTTQTYNPFLVPRKPVSRVKPPESKPQNKQTKPLVSMDLLPAEVLEDLKYKPPKRFKPSNASWVTKRLYKFLETKLEPKYDYKARVRAEKLVETIYNFTKDVKKHHVAPLQMVDALKYEMARLNIVTTHFDFYEFIQNYMPREIRIKVNPDVVNNIPLPKQGVFADIIT